MGFSNVLRLKLVVKIRGQMCCVDEFLMLALLNREFPIYCSGMRHLLLWQVAFCQFEMVSHQTIGEISNVLAWYDFLHREDE